ncbi:reverse transcriptase domain-containing protein, partial [Tanacetum coccineum]
IMPPKKTTTPMSDATIKELVAQSVVDALAEQEVNRAEMEMTTMTSGKGRSRRMESVFHISNCTVENQVNFTTCTLIGVALTWWNSHVKTVGHDVAYGMPWKTLMKMMTNKYCPYSEIEKLEIKIWNLKVKGTDVVSYTQCFQELALVCGRMFTEESDQVENMLGDFPT